MKLWFTLNTCKVQVLILNIDLRCWADLFLNQHTPPVANDNPQEWTVRINIHSLSLSSWSPDPPKSYAFIMNTSCYKKWTFLKTCSPDNQRVIKIAWIQLVYVLWDMSFIILRLQYLSMDNYGYSLSMK